MAAVKPRRSGGRSPAQNNANAKRVRRSAPPPSGNMPRLAAIKLSGGISGEEFNVSGKSLGMALGAMVLLVGVSIAGATFLGSSLFDAREAFARSADAAAANAGFQISNVQVAGVTGARAEEVRALIVPQGRHSILSLEPDQVRANIESLDWVEHARVRRVWPSTLHVDVVRRQAYARWQENGVVSVIDANGERLLAEQASSHNELPLVVGPGAGPAAEPLLIALEDMPAVRQRLRALVRVGDRRWDVELNSGTRIALPEAQPAQALAQLDTLQRRYDLLDRPVAEIDLRTPGRMAVRVHAQQLAGAENRAEGV